MLLLDAIIAPTYGRLYETVLIMSRVVVSFVSLKYFETDHVLIMKV